MNPPISASWPHSAVFRRVSPFILFPLGVFFFFLLHFSFLSTPFRADELNVFRIFFSTEQLVETTPIAPWKKRYLGSPLERYNKLEFIMTLR